MQNIESLLQSVTTGSTSILKTTNNKDSYAALDLSIDNKELATVDITNATDCESYIQQILNKTNSTIAFGGYLEKRNLYAKNANFSKLEEAARNIHLGVDFWADAGAKVIVPVNGVVHSFKNNAVFGDYGPTIILKHTVDGQTFYTLYGHLALSSLNDMYVGKEFTKGAVLATLGTAEVNVGYAPHLHFQIIIDIKDYMGDYPGVCTTKDLDFYKKNCPNPNLLLKI
ncbi:MULTISPECIES: peptidoglycan DD-metalloendopeptidase family protein [unclassified Cellulophaga]|uniref:peptidoglycan DD-metalloendopeptidase family protein n=1 Tax=unclassified Cellulophaga TaxID=2634405 RepID=UPI0026E29857|nr:MULTISPECIES: peptidoglycan DD-metalloendopeptidase family protein [unclassified Cellulophaga]MDO6490756.1 peptidoglycan DD-metalloendopeptidase family protein [Cellulophaga sp. 2_MG-2023]MDO6494050.1 peptidoglycan DD-metalloendopeptidase family protein [Cellulophaga sp. 3_MG-2023]